MGEKGLRVEDSSHEAFTLCVIKHRAIGHRPQRIETEFIMKMTCTR